MSTIVTGSAAAGAGAGGVGVAIVVVVAVPSQGDVVLLTSAGGGALKFFVRADIPAIASHI